MSVKRCFYGLLTLALGLAPCATAEDCVSMAAPYFANGTTAEVTIFNGQGLVSYANFDLQFKVGGGSNLGYLTGVASQLFNDRMVGAQPFAVSKADALALTLNLTTHQGQRQLEFHFVLGSWGNATTTWWEKDRTCLGNGYIAAVNGTGLYVIHLRRK
jgi:hypothetical protein